MSNNVELLKYHDLFYIFNYHRVYIFGIKFLISINYELIWILLAWKNLFLQFIQWFNVYNSISFDKEKF